jgi:hypothetical protein
VPFVSVSAKKPADTIDSEQDIGTACVRTQYLPAPSVDVAARWIKLNQRSDPVNLKLTKSTLIYVHD